MVVKDFPSTSIRNAQYSHSSLSRRFLINSILMCTALVLFSILTSDIFACKLLILKKHGSKWGTTSEFPMSDRKKKERRPIDLGATRVLWAGQRGQCSSLTLNTDKCVSPLSSPDSA